MTNLQIPREFTCRRCGFCCKHYGPELPFTQEDIDLWEAHGLDWIHYYPFIDWIFQEFVSPKNGIYVYDTVAEAKNDLASAELEFERDWGLKPDPFPWGGTLWYCPFLKWMGNKWGCLIHDYKSKTCRTYLCYWDRLKSAFESMFE